jgi:hypothetical protein
LSCQIESSCRLSIRPRRVLRSSSPRPLAWTSRVAESYSRCSNDRALHASLYLRALVLFLHARPETQFSSFPRISSLLRSTCAVWLSARGSRSPSPCFVSQVGGCVAASRAWGPVAQIAQSTACAPGAVLRLAHNSQRKKSGAQSTCLARIDTWVLG